MLAEYYRVNPSYFGPLEDTILTFSYFLHGYSKKREVFVNIIAFDLVTLVQTLQRLHTTTNSIIVVPRFMLFTFCYCKE